MFIQQKIVSYYSLKQLNEELSDFNKDGWIATSVSSMIREDKFANRNDIIYTVVLTKQAKEELKECQKQKNGA